MGIASKHLSLNVGLEMILLSRQEVFYSAFWAICYFISLIISAVGASNFRSAGFGAAAVSRNSTEVIKQ